MGACLELDRARIEVRILVKTGWCGIPKNAGARDRSQLKTPTMVEEISAWRYQKIYFRSKNMIFGNIFAIFHNLGTPMGGAILPYATVCGLGTLDVQVLVFYF